MKQVTIHPMWFPLAILLMLVAVVPAMAQTDTKTVAGTTSEKAEKFTESKMQLIEENLVRDLESPSVGVCIGGAQTIRELKAIVPDYSFSKAIIPLMRIVKDPKADRAARILAALALHDLESEKGDFAISREAQFSDDELFKNVCANLAKARKQKNKKE